MTKLRRSPGGLHSSNVRGRRSGEMGKRQAAAVLGGCCLVSFLYFGLPLVAHPARFYIGAHPDPEIFIWSFAWWPHAILHGLNPAVTHVIWSPTGINLTWTTSVPGLALLFAPLTWLAGPVIAYNGAALLMPAVAAWAMYLLARRLTGRVWPAIVAGYLYGFSSYLLAEALGGHLNLTAVFLVPLVALVVYRYLEGEPTHRLEQLRQR